MTNLNAYTPFIVWNFYQATSMTLSGYFTGALLAPKASINNPTGLLNGQVFVNSWNGVMEIHYTKFTGCLPFISSVQGAPPYCF